MSGSLPTFVVASDLHTLKARVDPQVSLIDAVVRRTPSLDATLRDEWQRFVTEWRAFVGEENGWRTTATLVDIGRVLEGKLRQHKSVLSSQCFGVPAPAPKRDVPFLPTWVTPNFVREQKTRIAVRVREIGSKVAQASNIDNAVRAAWGDFARAWSTFESEAEEWTHCAAQFENALAFEDVLPEWDDAIAVAALPQDTPPPFVPNIANVQPPPPPPPPFAIPSKDGGGLAFLGAAIALTGVLIWKGSTR